MSSTTCLSKNQSHLESKSLPFTSSPPSAMASHHHHRCYSHYNQPPSQYCCCSCPPPPPPPPPPLSTAADPLLQIIAAQIIQSHSSPHQPHKLLTPHKPTPRSYKAQHQSLLHSLARRVAALELSLQNLSSPPSSNLRDAAARTIQTHFRALLVRRSRTLSHLRLLASIKSNLAVLRASSSSYGKVDLPGVEAISRKAGDMLALLDSIESGDVMIREGKRSVGAELVQFLELMDGLAKRKTFSVKTVKKVTFANGGKENRIYAREPEPEIGSDDQSDLSPDDQHVSENKECSVSDDEGSHVELESFHQDEEEENNHVVYLSGNGHWGRNGGVQEHTVGGRLFAPLPIKMEPRVVEPDLVKKKKVVRIVSP